MDSTTTLIIQNSARQQHLLPRHPQTMFKLQELIRSHTVNQSFLCSGSGVFFCVLCGMKGSKSSSGNEFCGGVALDFNLFRFHGFSTHSCKCDGGSHKVEYLEGGFCRVPPVVCGCGVGYVLNFNFDVMGHRAQCCPPNVGLVCPLPPTHSSVLWRPHAAHSHGTPYTSLVTFPLSMILLSTDCAPPLLLALGQ